MQRARAAERDECEVARIQPLLDRDDAQRAHHLRVHDVDHTGRVDGSQRPLGGLRVELDPARQGRRQAPEEKIRVGHRGPGTTPPVASGAGIGTRALRADAQRPAFVEPDDRAAPRADGVHGEGRQTDRAGRPPGARARAAPHRRRSRTHPSTCRPCRTRARSRSLRAPRAWQRRRPRQRARREARTQRARPPPRASRGRPRSASRAVPEALHRNTLPRARRGSARGPGRGTRPQLSSTPARTRGTPARPRATRRRARTDSDA